MTSRLTIALTMVAVCGHLTLAVPPQPQTRDAAQARRTGTAVLAGVVTDDDTTPRPIRRARVTVAGTGAPAAIEVTTDDQGRFVFPDLVAGRYTLTADKPAYVKTFHGSKRVGQGPGVPIALDEGQRITDLRIVLLRGAVISGVVTDQNGVPLPMVQTWIDQMQLVGGERKLATAPGTSFTTTDDKGRYRFYGLPPGEYTIRAAGMSGFGGDVRESTDAEIAAALRELQGGAATAPGAAVLPPLPQVGFSMGYHLDASEPSRAQFIRVAAGEERTGINVRKTLVRVLRARVDGMALAPSGAPALSAMVGIANASTGSLFTSPGAVRPDATGRIVISNLPSGRWILFGRGAEGRVDDGSSMPLWTETEFEIVDRDLTGVVMQFHAGSTVSGRLTFRGTAAVPDVTKLQVSLLLLPKIAGAVVYPPSVSPKADGSFAVSGIGPGRYRFSVVGAAGWSLRSAVAGGRDMQDEPLEVAVGRDITEVAVTLIDQPAQTQVSGTMFDRLNRPTPEYSVVLFSTNRAHWTTAPRRMTGAVRLGSDGRFVVTGLPPGEYFVSAITDADPAQLSDPSFLDQLAAAAIRITLGEGEKKTQDLKIGG